MKGKYGEDLSVKFIADFMRRHREEKMFIYYPMSLPHWPMTPTPHSASWSKEPGQRLVADVKNFPDMVAYMDTTVGNLIREIEQLGLRDDTLILFYADNGTDTKITSHLNGVAVRGGKASPQQTGIRVPLIASWPGKIKPALNSDLIDPSDFLPTIAELVGRKIPAGWQPDGVSFAAPLLGTQGTPRDVAIFWYDFFGMIRARAGTKRSSPARSSPWITTSNYFPTAGCSTSPAPRCVKSPSTCSNSPPPPSGPAPNSKPPSTG